MFGCWENCWIEWKLKNLILFWGVKFPVWLQRKWRKWKKELINYYFFFLDFLNLLWTFIYLALIAILISFGGLNPSFCLNAVKMENKIWNFNIIVVLVLGKLKLYLTKSKRKKKKNSTQVALQVVLGLILYECIALLSGKKLIRILKYHRKSYFSLFHFS